MEMRDAVRALRGETARSVVLVVVSCLECHVDLRGYAGHVREMRDVMSDEDDDAASWPCEVLSPYGSPLAALRLYMAASHACASNGLDLPKVSVCKATRLFLERV